MRLGLVGYGVGGKYFHAPFIAAAQGIELVGVVTRSSRRRADLAAEYPGTLVYDSLTELLAGGVDAVTISTPPETRRALVLEAVAAGVHVIADKPFAPSAQGARELAAAAEEAGVHLNVFHNRRWDADLRTLAAVIDSGRLGQLTRVESRFDLDQPSTLETGPEGGLLRDLGSHLVDQVLWLLGPAASVYAELEWVDLAQGHTDAGFTIAITHTNGVLSHLSATKLNRIHEREWRAYGSVGGYISRGTDVQAQAIFAGLRPASSGAAWGYEAPDLWGTLYTAAGALRVPSAQGAYQDFYTQFAAALRGEADFPVPAHEGVQTVAVLDAARTSAMESRIVRLDGAVTGQALA